MLLLVVIASNAENVLGLENAGSEDEGQKCS